MEVDKSDSGVVETSINGTLISTVIRRDITSDTTLWFTSVAFRVYLVSAITVCGLVTNVINILVFSRMGLRDGTAATFLVLSVADGVMCFIGLFAIVFAGLRYQGPAILQRSVYSLYAIVLACATLPKNASTCCTVVIAVVRCCSVAMPLRVKSVLTVRRQLIAILVLVLSNVAVFSYTVTCYRIILVKDPATNFTQIILTLTPGWQTKIKTTDHYRGVTFYTNFIIINICLVVLIVSLKRSSQFRAAASSSGDMAATPGADKSNRRESQVVKTVVLVSAIFTICNLPGILMGILRTTLPGFRTVGYLSRSFDMLFVFVEFFGVTSGAINIIVYLYSNSAYRKVLNSLLSQSRKKLLQ